MLLAFAGLVAVALGLLGATKAQADSPAVTCTPSSPGPTGSIQVTASGTSASDSLVITASGGNYTFALDGGSACSTLPDDHLSGYPTVAVTGTPLPTRFVVGDASLHFTGEAGAANTLDLSALSAFATVSTTAATATWSGSNSVSFSGITAFTGSSSGTTFEAGGTGGYTFTGLSGSDTLDLSAAASGATISAAAGTVSGLTSGGDDSFSGIANFIGSSSGGTTMAVGSTGLTFQGQGIANALDLSHVATSPVAPLCINVTGGPVGSCGSSGTAVDGLAIYHFGGVSAFTGASTGYTTFFAGKDGGYTLSGQASSNVLDLSASTVAVSLSVPAGTVSGLTGSDDGFSGIQSFVGPSGGGSSFSAGSADGETFAAGGNGNTFTGGSGTAAFNGTGSHNSFVAGTGDATFNGGSGTGNSLDFSAVATTSGSRLVVNATSVALSVPSHTAAVGATSYVFSGISSFEGASSGFTTFYADSSSAADTFTGQGSGNTLNLSQVSGPSPTTVSVPGGTLQVGIVQGGFSGITSFVGAGPGNTTFAASGTGGYSFTGTGSGNSLDLSAAGPGVSVSVPDGTVSGLTSGGDDTFSGIRRFVGSSSGETTVVADSSNLTFQGQGSGNALDLSQAPTSSVVPLCVNVTGGPVGSCGSPSSGTAVAGATTYTFGDVSDFTGSSSGNTTFLAGAAGGFTFTGAGSSNTLDLSAVPSTGVSLSVPDGMVTGLSAGSHDDFSGISTFYGPIAGGASFTAGSAAGQIFNSRGNGNTFVAGSGDDTFNGGAGAGNTLDLSSLATPLQVNLSGSFRGLLANESASDGTTVVLFSGISTFDGAGGGSTTFYAPGTGGGYTFAGSGSGNTLDLSASSLATSVSVPQGKAQVGVAQDSFSGITGFVGAAPGNTTFAANGAAGYSFTGTGAGNSLDLSAAGSGLSISVPAGTVTGLTGGGGSDSFSGIGHFVGATAGDTALLAGTNSLTFQGQGSGNTLDFSQAATSPASPLCINMSGGPVGTASCGTVQNNTAVVGLTTYTFADVTDLTGSSFGNTTFFAGANGGFTFTGQGLGNALDLTAAAGATAAVNGDSTGNPGIVTGLTGGSDSFSGIQQIAGGTVTPPSVTGVSSTTANGTLGVGGVVAVTVAFSEPVNVVGTPRLALNSGGTATYSSGSGTSTLTFTYTVASGQNANPLDELSTGALSLNGGAILDLANDAAVLTLPAPGTEGSLGANRAIVIDTTPPTVTNVTSTTADGVYGVGANVSVTVSFSEPVIVTGTPQLALDSGGTAGYTSGSGTSTLTFGYTVGAGQDANPLDEASAIALSLNGGTIKDGAANPATLTLPAPGAAHSLGANKSIVIDTTAPTVTNVSSTTANGPYGAGATITLTVSFGEAVIVTGTPQLALNSGGTASYSSGSGTNVLSFTYTVGAGQNSAHLDYTSAGALTLNGGAIEDAAMNAATLTLPAPGTPGSLGASKAIVIDTIAPTITNVTSSTPDGSYGIGATVSVTVSFSEGVVVTGTPLLALNSGGTASYSSGSGTTTLTFGYTVAAGQNANPLDEASASALSLNGGTIRDGAANAATLTLPAPGTSGSLGANKSIVIDTTPPMITISTAAGKDSTTGWYNIASSGTSGISVDVSATDASGVSSLSCSDGTTSVLSTTSSGSFTLHDGDHHISCSATDTVGNGGSANHEFKVDQTRPTIVPSIGAPKYGSSPAFVASDTSLTFTVGDGTSGVGSCSITVTDPASTTHNPACGTTGGTYELDSALLGGTPADGLYGNTADATDVAGNTATESSFSVRLDNTGPAITVNTPPSSDVSNPTVYSYGSVPNASYSCNDGTGSGVAASGGCVGKVGSTTVNSGSALVGTVGPHTLAVMSKDNLGNPGDPVNHYYDVQASTSIVYTGDESVTYPSAVKLSATLSSAATACSAVQQVTFTITDSANNVMTRLSSTSSSGVAGPVSVTLPEGVYTVEASYGGTAAACLASHDEATIVVGSAGSKATGGGFTTVNGVGRVNFAFVVDQVPGTGTSAANPAQYKGQYVLVKPNGWRFKGTFGNAVGGTYVVTKTSTGKSGSGTGTGTVYVWDASSATFVPAAGGGNVTFGIGFADNGSSGKKQTMPDQFANHENYDPAANGYSTTLNAFPNFLLQAIKGGNITIS